jgi:drug/metabolite transporter (DMT)-like permease
MIQKPRSLVKGDDCRGKPRRRGTAFAWTGSTRYNRHIPGWEIVIANRFIVPERPSRLVALAEALVVNVIWATTFILIKIGLGDLGPLTLGGLRYFGGFLLLLPLMLHGPAVRVNTWTRTVWLRLALLGVSAYAVGNGALFWGLQYIPATTGSFILSLTPLPVLFLGIFWLKEIPTHWQWAGMGVAVIGSGLFFSPGLSAGDPRAVAVVMMGLAGFALFGILGRAVARDRQVDTLSLTALPLAFGGGTLLVIALLVEGLPRFSGSGLVVVLWLAVVNTAFAYVVYNHALQVMTAFEMNILMNLAPLITATLAWLFLDERLEPIQLLGLITVILGIVLVEWGRRNDKPLLQTQVSPMDLRSDGKPDTEEPALP